MKLRREKFAPDLIDLEQYEKDCLYARYKGRRMQPVWAIPDLGGLSPRSWTDSEMQAMRDNRDRAEEIANRISRLVIMESEGNVVMDEEIAGQIVNVDFK